MTRMEEAEVISKAIKAVERAQTAADAGVFVKELEQLMDRPKIRGEVLTILSGAKGIAQSYSLRQPDERNTPIFRRAVEDLRERAANLE